MPTGDNSIHLQELVRQAHADNKPLVITGGGSKAFYGRPVAGETLSTTGHAGIVAFEPTELVLTARAGTPLHEIENTLAASGQVLASEPPQFADHATLGGMVAAGLSGPARPYRASVQDSVLGCTILNGKGEILRFGGKVMKNVAGYDISRLMVGSMGCLGVILDVTLKVVPAPAAEASYVFTLENEKGPAFVNDLRRQGLPVSASCQRGREILVRFSAGDREIGELGRQLSREYGFVPFHALEDNSFWHELREQRLDFFTTGEPLWRLSVPADAELGELVDSPEAVITEWGGALHWLKTRKHPDTVFEHTASLNGHATLFRNPGEQEQRFQPLPDSLLEWHRQLKKAFDPAGIFNPGKMYTEL